ncbi:MAG: prepilin peptidase [Gemmata sp.]
MTPELVHQPLAVPTLRRRYRQLVSLPARVRWGGGCAFALGAAALGTASGLPPATGMLVWLLAAATVTDLLWRRIFNCQLVPVLACVALLHAAGALGLHTGLPAPAQSALGLGLCFALMLVLYVTFRGGEGDVKMVAVLGALLGCWHGIEAAMIGYLLAAAVAVVLVVARLVHRAVSKAPGGRTRVLQGTLPMAPFFAAGTVLTLL